MKTRSLIFCLLSSVFFFQNIYAADKNQALIKGKITNIPASVIPQVLLSIHYGRELIPIDSTVTDEKGEFQFISKGKAEQAMYKLTLKGGTPATVVIGKETPVEVYADYDSFKNGKLNFKNSAENEAFAILYGLWSNYKKASDNLNAEAKNLNTFAPHFDSLANDIKVRHQKFAYNFNLQAKTIKEQYPGTYTADVIEPLCLIPEKDDFPKLKKLYDNDNAFLHAHYFDYINFADERIISNPILEDKYYKYLSSYTKTDDRGFKEAVDTLVSFASKSPQVKEYTLDYLINIFTKNGPDEIVTYIYEKYFATCDAPVRSATQQIINKIKMLSVGKPAPELTCPDSANKPVLLSSVIAKNKAVLLLFWFSGCPHCREELPDLKTLYYQYKRKGLEIYAVSLDDKAAEWKKAINDFELNWVNVSELKGWNAKCVEVYDLKYTPTIYIINQKGEITARYIRGDDIGKKLKEMLD